MFFVRTLTLKTNFLYFPPPARDIIQRSMSSDSGSDAKKRDWNAVYEKAKQKIDDSAEELNALSQAIWSRPELAYKEQFAHQVGQISLFINHAAAIGDISLFRRFVIPNIP